MSTGAAGTEVEYMPAAAADDPGSGAPGLPRLLAGVPTHGAMSLPEHLDIHGEPPASRRDRRWLADRGSLRSPIGGDSAARRSASALVDQIEQAGLGGRGGAGFPLARKMRSVAAGKGRPVVLVNATEGEPASLKDRTLLEALPHLVLDGAALAARALGADEAILCVCESAEAARECAAAAIAERKRLPGHWPQVVLATAPEGYVTGQESALVSYLNGGEAKPTFTPPAPYERGLRRRPTLVSNAETLAHVALIARHGARWFRQLGLSEQPGSTLITLSGPLVHPGVYEIEFGATLASLIEAAGGMKARVRGALFGGYAGSWVEASALSGLALSNAHLAPYGATLGAGVVALLSEQACPVAEVTRVTRWLERQSAGQCGPCVHGLGALADTLEQAIRGGVNSNEVAARVEQLAGLVARRGACGHPDGTARFAISGIEVFASEFADHARHGACDACARAPELPLPAQAQTRAARSAT